MARKVAIGIQDFEKLISNNYFYVDKTAFIREWWECGDEVTLIMRPRRFGKTLNMNMVERFFSNEYAGKGEIFEGLDIWKEQKYRDLQGTYPVIFLSFASVKERNFEMAKKSCVILSQNYILKTDFYLIQTSCVMLKGNTIRAFQSTWTRAQPLLHLVICAITFSDIMEKKQSC